RYFHVTGVQTCALPIYPQSATRVAPFPSLGLFTSFQSTNISHYNGLQVSARKNLDKRMQFQVSYTLSKAVGLSDDIFEPGVPQRSEERRVGEEGRLRVW